MPEKKQSLWSRLRAKYAVEVVNEQTLAEMFRLRLSLMNLMLLFVGMLLVTLFLFAWLIWSTPLKNYLPGFDENVKEQLAMETFRVDSLQRQMDLQASYLDVIRSVVAGEMETDSLYSLDTLTIEEKQVLLDRTFPATDEFMAQYEQRMTDNLSLFDIQSRQSVNTLFRPAKGVVTEPFDFAASHYGIRLKTLKGENVTACLSGTIVYADFILQEGWMVMIQHGGDYLSIYRGVGKLLRQVGGTLQAGETFGLIGEEGTLQFELWQHGNAVNPEDVIVF